MSLGSLVLELQANLARTQEDMGRLNQIVESAMNKVNAAAGRASSAIENMGRAGGNIRRVQGAEDAARDIEKIGHASTGARRELLVLAHELATGNFKRAAGSVMVLGERMDWMGAIMSPVGLAVGGLVAVVAGLAVAAVKGAMESHAFAQSLILTGNAAGTTEGRYNAMSQAVAQASNTSIGSAREMTQALLSTGRVGGEALAHMSIAASSFAAVSGQKSEEVVKDFSRMSDGVMKWALDMNKQTHFMTGALFDQIKALEDAGEHQKAMIVASDALTDAMHRESDAVNEGGLSWQGFKNWLSSATDATEAWLGRTQTVETRLASLKLQLASMQTQAGAKPGGLLAQGSYQGNSVAALQARIGELTSLQRRQSDNADLTATRKAHDDEVVEAKSYWAHLLETTRTGSEQLKIEQDKIQREGTLAGASQSLIDAEKAKAAKRFAGSGGAGLAKADLESQLKPIQDQITAETRLLATRDKVLAQYYRDNLIGEKGFYDTSAVVIEAYNKRVSSLYDDEIAKVEAAAKRTTDARQKIELQTKADALRDEKTQALLGSSERLSALTVQQAKDTEQYRLEVEKLESELGKLNRQQGALAGADFDRTHKTIRDKATANGDTGTLADLDQGRAQVTAQAQINQLRQEAQAITEALAVTEKTYALEVKTGQLTELGNDLKLSEARTEAAAQLANLAQQMQQIAAASGMPMLTLQAQQFGLQVKELQASSNVLGNTIQDTFANGFARMLDNSITRTKSLRQSFLDMANSIEQAISKIVSQDLANQLFGTASGGGSGGSGGLIAQLIGWAIGASAGDMGSENLGASATSTPDDLISGYRATGGPTIAGGMYEVNERGPELLTVANRTFLMMGDKDGKVSTVGSGAGGSGGNTYHMNIAVPAGTTRQSAQQQAAEIMRHAQIAQNRNS